ncbi:hypothetical protein EIN_174060 [Entamoeba invadens IP1]|uniref:Uncharacterized protein n=1 Tax=Entamoeba invadens IP1 TaxID=370355 RepID=A0A0A1TW70_ENTIV|nr:hypothetical protein EIN_174060 [Entamoeba invadens IP1]ELP84731.1 hypothetical protein EIN_174060 [Entamoeba invadens IP1]|eukprot:XP_004184077.1 hypothetical protein EIN_174060 [Entamoeba invadens IP1]
MSSPDDIEIKRQDSPYNDDTYILQQMNDFNCHLDQMVKEHLENQKQFSAKYKEAIKSMSEEIVKYRATTSAMQEGYLKLLEDTRRENNTTFSKEVGQLAINEKLQDIQKKMSASTEQFNTRNREVKELVETTAKKLNFDEMKAMKERVEQIVKALREIKNTMEIVATKSEDLKTQQMLLNEELGYVLAKVSLEQKTATIVKKVIETKNVELVAKAFIGNPKMFDSRTLNTSDLLDILNLISLTFASKTNVVLVELIVEIGDAFENVVQNVISDQVVERLEIVISRIEEYIKTPLAPKTPNVVTAYRVTKDLIQTYKMKVANKLPE